MFWITIVDCNSTNIHRLLTSYVDGAWGSALETIRSYPDPASGLTRHIRFLLKVFNDADTFREKEVCAVMQLGIPTKTTQVMSRKEDLSLHPVMTQGTCFSSNSWREKRSFQQLTSNRVVLGPFIKTKDKRGLNSLVVNRSGAASKKNGRPRAAKCAR